jgi:hypothetical protein
MIYPVLKRTVAIVLSAGLLLRALTPLGYMPGTSDDGFVFELCPEQLPPGFVMPGAGSANHQHHHGNSGESPADAEPDLCQIGHLLFSAMAVDQSDADIDSEQNLPQYVPESAQIIRLSAVSAYRSRAPPA